MSYADQLLRKMEKADPRDRWKYGLGKRPPDHVRNGPLNPGVVAQPLPAKEDGIRPDCLLHEISPFDWTEDEAFGHLQETYQAACKAFPDIMEKFQIVSIDVGHEREALMEFWRLALRETFGERYPNRFLLGKIA